MSEDPEKRPFYTVIPLLFSQTIGAFNDNAMKAILPVMAAAQFGKASMDDVNVQVSVLLILPFVIFAPLAGWVSDRFSKKKVVSMTLLAQLFGLGLLSYGLVSQSLLTSLIGFFLLSTQSAFLSPAKKGMLKELIGSNRLAMAVGWTEMLAMVGILGGAFVGAMSFDALVVGSTPNTPPANLDSNCTLVMRENEAVGTVAGTITAVDPDGNGSLRYYLYDANGTPGDQYFAMDLNGTLRTDVVLDYEANASHFVRVRVYDEFLAYAEGTFTVTVLDVNESGSSPNTPPDNLDSDGTLVMGENEAVGTTVGTFTAVDPDGNGSLRYYLHYANGTSGNQYFTMDLNGTLRTAVVLDYEANASHLIRVRVYDDFQAYAEGNFTVTVSDVNESVPNTPPAKLDSTGTLEMRENEVVGTAVGNFTAVDPDRNGSLHYYLYDADGMPGNQYFTMDFNGTLRTAAVLDYETNASHLIRVRVYDDFQTYAEGNFTIAVLDVNESETEGWNAALILALGTMALAFLSWLAFLPTPSTEAPKAQPFKIGVIWSHFGDLRDLLKDRKLRGPAFGDAWFWSVGGFFYLVIVKLSGEVVEGDVGLGTLYGYWFLLLGLGIMAGSLFVAYLNRGKIELGLTVIGGLIMPVSLVILFLSNPMGKVFDAGCLSLGFSGALFFVPLNGYLQDQSEEDRRGRVLAATNLFTQLSGIAFIFFHYFLSSYVGLTAKQELLVILVPSLLVGFITLRALPGGISRVGRHILGR